jgi:hypothetical protein
MELPEKYKDARFRCYLMEPDDLLDLLKLTAHQLLSARITSHNLPADAEFIDIWWRQQYRAFSVNVWSSTFDPVPEGNIIPLDINKGTLGFLRVKTDPNKEPGYTVIG